MFLGPAGSSGFFKVIVDHSQVAFLFLYGVSGSIAYVPETLGVVE